jgi:hypothetical protein
MEIYWLFLIIGTLILGIFIGTILKIRPKKLTIETESLKNIENMTTDIMKVNKEINVTTGAGQELFQIIKFDNHEEIDKSALEVPMGQLNHILSVVPNALASKSLSGAYKVIMPAGATGPLIQRTSGPLKGLYDTTTKSAGGGFGPHAGLQSLNPAAIALGVFTVLSFVTGQYFLAEINKKLSEIKNEIIKLEKMFENKIIAEIKSSIYFIQDVMNNLNQIIQNERLVVSTLTNIQSSNILLLQNSIWYEEEIKNIISRIQNYKNVEDIKKDYNILMEKIGFWLLSIYGYFYGKVIEIILSQNFDENYLEQAQKSLYDRAQFYKDSIQTYCEKLFKSLNTSKAADWNILDHLINLFDDKYESPNDIEIKNIIKKTKNNLDKKHELLYSIPDAINKLRFSNGLQLIVKDDKAYIIQ